MTEISLPNWNKLPQIEQAYLHGLLGFGFSPDILTPYVDLLLFPTKIPEAIAQTHRKLQEYAVLPDTAKNPKIRDGYKILRQFFANRDKDLREKAVSVSVYGSLRYDDAVNLDYDVQLFMAKTDKTIMEAALYEWNDELIKLWKIGQEGHLSLISIEELESYCARINQSDLNYIDGFAMDIDIAFEEAGTILTGYSGFSPIPEATRKHRTQILDLMYKNPIMGATIAISLQEALTIREDRRK